MDVFARLFLWVMMPLSIFSILPQSAFAQQSVPQKIELNKEGFTPSVVCGKCHKDIYDRWKDSLHARSTSDPIFRAAYMEAHYKSQGKAEQLCLRCHAPTTKFTKGYNLDVSLTSEGLTCDFCHSLKDVDLSNEEYPFIIDFGEVKYGPNKKGDEKAHKIKFSPLHQSAKLCASCHEYTPNGVPVMSTYSEWKKSVYADNGTPCQKCHMPEVPGTIAKGTLSERGSKIYSHNLAGGHSISQLKKAVKLEIAAIDRRRDRMTVTVKVINEGSGHRLPTGIPSRKVILFCEVKIPGGKAYRDKVVYEKVIFDANGSELTRDADIMLGFGASIAKDNRLFPKEVRTENFTFYIPESRRASISVWIDYLYNPIIMRETEMRIEMNRDETVSSPNPGK